MSWFLLLLLAFTVVPAVEIGLFVTVGGQIGALSTVGIVLLTGVAGAALARSQGTAVLLSIERAMQRGEMPTDQLVEGLLVLIGGLLLLTPGFLTDLVGLGAIAPPTRVPLAALVRRWAAARIQAGPGGSSSVGGFTFFVGNPRPPAQDPAPRDPPMEPREGGRVIEADFRPKDD